MGRFLFIFASFNIYLIFLFCSPIFDMQYCESSKKFRIHCRIFSDISCHVFHFLRYFASYFASHNKKFLLLPPLNLLLLLLLQFRLPLLQFQLLSDGERLRRTPGLNKV